MSTKEKAATKAATNLFLMELDAFLSSHVQSEISCRDLKRGMYAIAMKHRTSKSTNEVLDIVRHVADQCVQNDTVNVESLRRTLGTSGKTTPSTQVPRGYVIPRGVRYDGQRPGWIRDTHYGWLMPISDVYKLKMYKRHQMQHLQTRLVQWSLILGFIALACFVVSLYRAHVRVYHSNNIPKNPKNLTQTDIDRQFLQAPPPTMLEVRSVSASPVASTSLPIQYSQMPNTTDLMRDFSQIKQS